MNATLRFLLVLCLSTAVTVSARSQDSTTHTTNNMVLPEGYPTSEAGEPGAVVKAGQGGRTLILIAGWGFGAELFDNFIQQNRENYTMYAVTLPGFDDTSPPPLPPEETSYGKQVWTRNAVDGVVNLIRSEGLEKPVVVGHYITSTQVALRLAIDHPDLIGGVVIAGGSAKTVNPQIDPPPTLEDRIKINDEYYGPKWFKSISEEDWDEGNYPPVTYSRDPELAGKYWDIHADVILPVMIQYLQEFNASDLSLEFGDIKVPTLIMIPSFSEEAVEEFPYLKYNFRDSWEGAEEANSLMEVVDVAHSHLLIMVDRPQYFDEIVTSFVEEIDNP